MTVKRTMVSVAIFVFGLMLFAQNIHPVMNWDFDDVPDSIEGNYRMVPGITGSALKLDGFTTVINHPAGKNGELNSSFTIETWIALAAYPWNWCPVITQMEAESSGYSFEIGPHGEIGLKMNVGRNLISCISDETLDLRKWTHIACSYEEGFGIKLYVNGEQVGEYKSIKQPAFAPKKIIRIGMNYKAVFPSDRIGEHGITPYWFSIDGILDDLKVHNEVISPDELCGATDPLLITTHLPAPEISPRHLPRVEDHDVFQAYYTKLEYYPEWDDQWPVASDADIVISFENSPVQLIFWRGTRYSPAWVSDNNLWMCDQSVETWNGPEGCKEHMQDRHCKYSHVRLIENTAARKVVHWRYAPVSAYNTLWLANEKTGWAVWIDEYYYIYPDATAIRKVSWKTEYMGHPRQFQESLPLTGPGQTRNDVMEIDYLKVANLDGDQMPFFYTDKPRVKEEIDFIDAPNIQQHNFKSAYDPFIIFDPGNNMHYLMDRNIRNLDFPGSCNHWPVGQAYCDGRSTVESDRVAHFLGFPISNPVIHDEKNGRSYWASIYGMGDLEMNDLIRLGRSWAQAPELIINSKGFSGGEYSQDKKAYRIRRENGRTLKFEIKASENSPLYNPAITIDQWNMKQVNLELNGKKLKEGKDFFSGLVHDLKGTTAVIFIMIETDSPLRIAIK
ncbi:MAG: LamG domain-containing protein [Bacteroidetes bacterium]|jgi:hypothetical protein|nr:LamG domain-containing protein [Bacteroidota bacterium]MBT3750977.1 LamG domain-containing protein [Bacteroidota bacterium]MBT4412342.1 LamG domain-containing protein [Bacteroidota bacterium]MBT5425652.1 LamG domain-containing protein [Bacteroidota bacterium]MBT7092694.1 LamG domain-containing protein [Bacteroidota bacterium]